jgi:hypothetical protein
MVISEFGSEISSVQIRRARGCGFTRGAGGQNFSDTFGVDIIPIDLHCASGFFDKRFAMRSVA